MRLVQVDPKDYKHYKKTKSMEIISQFIDSGYEMAKLEYAEEYKNAYVCSTSLNSAIKRFKYAGIKAVVINGEVFLVNTMLAEKKGE